MSEKKKVPALLPFEIINMTQLRTMTAPKLRELTHVLAVGNVAVVVPADWYSDVVELLKGVHHVR